MREPIALGVVVNRLHDVTGEVVIRPERATVLGPVKVIPQEYANVRSRVIDVTLPEDERPVEALAAQLIAELDEPGEAPVVAYRGAHRWLQSLESAPLDAATAGAALRHTVCT